MVISFTIVTPREVSSSEQPVELTCIYMHHPQRSVKAQ